MTGELLIDTSALIDFFEQNSAPETKEILATADLVISAITYGEIYKFLLNRGKTSEWQNIKTKLNNYKIIDATKETSEKAAELSHRFGLSFADSLIYATAIIHDLKLLTSDSDFKGKPNVILGKRIQG